MRFFDTNYLFENFGGSVEASSNEAAGFFAFDEDLDFVWSSDGEGTDGTAISLQRNLESAVSIDRIFVKNTNINDLTIEVDLGAGFISLATASTFNLIKSNAGTTYFFELDNEINIEKIKFIGSNTITPNQEKIIQQCLSFVELGVISNNADIQPKRTRIQVISQLNSGKFDIVNKGRQFTFKLKFKSHYKEADNEIMNTILQRTAEVWLWINNDEEDSMKMNQEPFRFEDIYKVGFQKSDSLRFNENAFFSGVNVDFDLIEVA